MALAAQPRREAVDPYELERLAEELELREQTRSATLKDGRNGADDDSNSSAVPNLPAYVPLSHENSYLNAGDFDVEKFLLSRSYTSLPDLRAELREYLASLKEELVKLINDDYEAFISLSTDLRDEGTRLEKLKQPLGGIRNQILGSKQELNNIQSNIQDKLKKRTRLREEKTLLQLLLKISDSITRLEKLLAIGTPEDDPTDSLELSLQKLGTHHEGSADEKLPANRAKHLARVATEYTQLLYHVSKAREENCVFINGVQWRIDRIQSTLSSDLDSILSTTLTNLTDRKSSELERTKWIADLTECLRTYDLLGLWRDAEDIIRRQVVRKFVKKTIYPGALNAPHSPIIPHTPFHPDVPEPMLSASFAGPQTPYTPFTAFVPKQNAAFPSGGPMGSKKHQAYLLDDTNDPLAKLYNQILRFIERDICYIMEAAEGVHVKSKYPRDEGGSRVSTLAEEKSFSILGNVVWEELSRAIQDEIGGIVFAAGRPDEFRKHYETTQAFIRSIELLAPSLAAVTSFRAHESYSIFEKRWQLPVYFQLRWKEIVGKLEESLIKIKLEVSYSKDLQPFATHQASAVWIAVSACWSYQVFIPELCPRFWKLTLQVLSRYHTWLSACLNGIDAKAFAIPEQQNIAAESTGRPGTPMSNPDGVPVENAATDDALLRQYAAAIVDVLALDTALQVLWQQEISVIIPEPDSLEGMEPKDAFDAALSKLTDTVPALSSMIVGILTRRCAEALVAVRSITTQLRAMSNKRMPTEASHFVTGVLRPVKQFFGIGSGDGTGARLKAKFLHDYAVDVFNAVTIRYINYLNAMKKNEESLKRLRKTKKPAFSLFGNSSNTDDEAKDEERIRAQMILDVEAFGKDARGLGVDVESNKHFKALKEVVHNTDTE